MLIARAPVRVSFAGGGTDLPIYYEQYGGLVVSTTIDKYFYVVVNINSSDSVQVSSSDYRVFYRHRPGEQPLWDGDLRLVKAALHEFDMEGGISLFLASEIPPGTGLGSSSAVTAALIKALGTLQGLRLDPEEVAERACALEREKLRAAVGKQDQYAVAFGGLNAISFTSAGIRVERVAMSVETYERLQRNMLLFFTGSTHVANAIMKRQEEATASNRDGAVAALHAIKDAARETRECFERGDLRRYGEILGETWEQKKRLAAGISNPRVDEVYELALRHGAIGGKLAGAGGGGFLMLYCEEPQQAAVVEALEGAGLYHMDFRFERGGAQVIMNSTPRISWQRATHPQREYQYA